MGSFTVPKHVLNRHLELVFKSRVELCGDLVPVFTVWEVLVKREARIHIWCLIVIFIAEIYSVDHIKLYLVLTFQSNGNKTCYFCKCMYMATFELILLCYGFQQEILSALAEFTSIIKH